MYPRFRYAVVRDFPCTDPLLKYVPYTFESIEVLNLKAGVKKAIILLLYRTHILRGPPRSTLYRGFLYEAKSGISQIYYVNSGSWLGRPSVQYDI
jgi:hypothetical protein